MASQCKYCEPSRNSRSEPESENQLRMFNGPDDPEVNPEAREKTLGLGLITLKHLCDHFPDVLLHHFKISTIITLIPHVSAFRPMKKIHLVE